MKFYIAFVRAGFVTHHDGIEVIEQCDQYREDRDISRDGNVSVQGAFFIQLKKSGGQRAADFKQGKTGIVGQLFYERMRAYPEQSDVRAAFFQKFDSYQGIFAAADWNQDAFLV